MEIVEEFIEKQTAKIPGRPIFNAMLDRIEKGEANGILAWHPDRLARNSVDGGRIIYLLDCGHLAMLKFPTFWYENTAQGKFMLNIAFGQSKYYVDSLSENTKRGLRQKVRRGEYPSLAPVGYINDPRTKTIMVDRKRAPIIRRAFELYAQGNMRLEDISDFLAREKILTRGGKRIHITRTTFILKNPFYVGLFRYAGEIYEGKHEPIIAKKLFDRVQEILTQKSRPHHKPKNEPKAYCGLIRCGECGRMITAEKQKGHIYYRCTKKWTKCSQPYIREEELDRQLSSMIQKVSLRQNWAEKLLNMAEAEKQKSAQSSFAFAQEANEKIKAINIKLQRLLDGYLEQDIDREVYRQEKAKLLSEKKSLEEQLRNFEQKQNDWLESFQSWIKVASNLDKTARDNDLFQKKVLAKEIFGSNLRLASRAVAGESQNQWAALYAAHQLFGQKPESEILVSLRGIEPRSQPPEGCALSVEL